ncbi:MAG: SDR family oxidoreductase [Nanoarchaeota archaeon]
MHKILIFGNGQLGNLYKDFFNNNNYKSEIAQVDITNEEEVQKAVDNFKPNIVINTAAKTNTDWCEENRLETFKVNTLGADNVAKVCLKNNIFLIHISSGCIFESIDGKPIFKETDLPKPIAFYSWTKTWADQLLQDKIKKGLKVLILRPRLLLSSKVHPRNILHKMLNYKEFHTNPNSMTIADDLLLATKHLIDKNQTGIFNITNSGTISPHKIALMLKDNLKDKMEINIKPKEELDKKSKVKRVDAIIDTTKLEKTGLKLPDITKRIEETILKLKENMQKNQ